MILYGERLSRRARRQAARALLDVADAPGPRAARDGAGLLEVPAGANGRGLREAGVLPDAGPGLRRRRAPAATRAAIADGRARRRADRALPAARRPAARRSPDRAGWERALDARARRSSPTPTSSPTACASTPTSSSRPRPTPRRRARSCTPTAACSGCARRSATPATCAPDGRCSPSSPRARRASTSASLTGADGVRAAVRGGAVLRGPDARGDRRPRRALAGARRRRRVPGGRAGRPLDGAREPPPARRAQRRACAWAPSARSGPRPRSRVSPALHFLAPAAARRALARGRRSASASPAATRVVVGADGARVRARRVALRDGASRRARVFLADGRRADGGQRADDGAPRRCEVPHEAVTACRSPSVGYYEPWWIQILKALVIFAVGFQLVPDRADRRAQAARPLPGPLRPQPRRPVRAAAADRRHRQVARQGAVPPAHLGRLAVRARAGDLDHHRGRGARDHPVRRRRSTSSARTSASTGSTSSIGAAVRCSRSARSPSTG